MSDSPILEVISLDFPWAGLDPFIFTVHHLDRYPAATEEMGRRLEKVLHDLASQWLIFRRFFGDPPPQNGSPERAA